MFLSLELAISLNMISQVQVGQICGRGAIDPPSGIAPSVPDDRITEAGDTRITEAGDTRILES